MAKIEYLSGIKKLVFLKKEGIIMAKIETVKVPLMSLMDSGICYSYDTIMKEARLRALEFLGIKSDDEDMCGMQGWVYVEVHTGGKKKGVKLL